MQKRHQRNCQGWKIEEPCKRLWKHLCSFAWSQMFSICIGADGNTFVLSQDSWEGEYDLTFAGMMSALHVVNAASEMHSETQ